jgi:two-component system, NtrC family, response regulator AtoC
MMLRGQFREDLYYRLKVIEAVVPPLRERRDEIPQLTDFFIAKYSRRYNRPVRPLSDELRQRFLGYDWPGNIRELENMIKRFVILQDEQLVLRELSKPRPAGPVSMTPSPATAGGSEQLAPPPFQSPPTARPPEPDPEEDDDETDDDEEVATPAADGRRLADVAREAALNAERAIIADTLKQVHWNRRKAAQLLGVSYKTLLNKIRETGLERP